MPEVEIIKGKVVKILNNYQIIADVGYADGVKKDMNFIIYTEGEEILDPDTKKPLGKIEHLKARIEPLHIQEKITIMETYEKEISKIMAAFRPSGAAIERQKPFITAESFKGKDDVNLIVKVGDQIRQDLS